MKDEAENGRIGPPTSFIQVAKPFIFEQSIQECLKTTGVSQVREDTIRLAGVQWIDNVRKALKLWESPLSRAAEMLTRPGPSGPLTPLLSTTISSALCMRIVNTAIQ